MRHVIWDHRPRLERPMLVTAFSGWNDAGDAASSALRFVADEWNATPAGHIDPDAFYDFTQVRPSVLVDESGERRIEWPTPTISATTGDDVPPAVFLAATEPQLRWRAFCDEIVALAHDLDVSRVVHLGALLAEVPHSRPVPVTVSGHDAEARPAHAARYQGPTGIVGVLHQACEDAGLPTTSLWAAVPTYVSGASSPKAALALVRRLATLVERPVATGLLEISAQAYEREISQLVDDDEDTSGYVRRLEHDFDDEHVADADGLTDEIERYLRDRRR